MRAAAAGWRWSARRATFVRTPRLWWSTYWRLLVLVAAVLVGMAAWAAGGGWVVLLVLAVIGAVPVLEAFIRPSPAKG